MGSLIKNRKKYAEYENLIKSAGYRRPTMLQQLVLPSILENRDVTVESGIHPGKTLAIAISIILKGQKIEKGCSVMVVTSQREQAQKLLKTFSGILSSFNPGLSVVTIGFSDLIKKEVRQLGERPNIVISTPERMIDHIRRGNIDLSGATAVYIDEGEEYEQEFENDLCFILSKINGTPQIVRFSYARETRYTNLERLLKRPVIVQEKDFVRGHGSVSYWYLVSEDLEGLFVRVMLSFDVECVVIVVDSPALGKKIQAMLASFFLDGIVLSKETSRARIEKAIDCSAYEHLDFIIAYPDTLPNITLEGISHIVFFDVSDGDRELPKLIDPSQLGEAAVQCITLVPSKKEKQFLTLQERHNVKMEKKDVPTNENVIKGALEMLVKKSSGIGTQTEMDQYKKAVRKAVPLGKRSLMIAYLLKEKLQKTFSKETEFTTLFLNIGRLRGAAEKDITVMFTTRLSIDRSLIKDVRVFDNYAFVDIAKEYADNAITKLSQIDFKGKRLIVNYSRKKTERKDFGNRRRSRRT